jgi:hypothetical protein
VSESLSSPANQATGTGGDRVPGWRFLALIEDLICSHFRAFLLISKFSFSFLAQTSNKLGFLIVEKFLQIEMKFYDNAKLRKSRVLVPVALRSYVSDVIMSRVRSGEDKLILLHLSYL